MTKFFYRAKQGPNDVAEGTIEADNLDNAVQSVIELGLTPIDVYVATKREELLVKKSRIFSFSFPRRINPADRTIFTRQLSDLIEAGVPLLQALNIAVKQMPHALLRQIIEKVRDAVRDGSTLSDALAFYPALFPRLYTSMIHSGEISGNLGLILSRLAEFSERDEEVRSKVKSSLIYPSLILIVGAVTIFVLLSFVIPRLTVMFDDLSQDLPLITVILVAASRFLERFWWLIILFLVGGLLYLKKVFSTSEGKFWLDSRKLRLPVLGRFIADVELGRFARTLGTLLDSGVVIVTALETVCGLLDNEVFRNEIRKVHEEVGQGTSLSRALENCPHFPEDALHMIVVGEESGRLEQSLYKLADTYERRSDRSVKAVTSLLEPLLIVFVGSVVGFIVIAMLLPIFKMNLIIQ